MRLSSAAISRLAIRLDEIETQLKDRSPQLAYSSIENGSLDEYDIDGKLVQVIGKQYDGTHGAVTVAGPTPPRPSKPILEAGPALLTFSWDGTFADEITGETDITIAAPITNFRTEVHMSQTPGFIALSADTLVDSIESPRGSSRTIRCAPGKWYVVVVVRGASGNAGQQSLEASIVVPEPVGSDVDVDALREEFQTAQSTLQTALAENAAELLTLTEGPIATETAENIAEATQRFLKVTTDQLVVGSAAIGDAVAKKFAAEVGSFMKLNANQVFIGEAGNMERDPNFELLDGWDPLYLSDPTILRHDGGGYNGANAISFPATTEREEVSGLWRYDPDGRFSFPVEAGEKYRVSCWVQTDRDIPAQGVALFLRASTPAVGFWGVEVEESAQNEKPIKAGVWTKISGIVTMPENATSAFLGYFRFSNSRSAVVRFSTPNVQQAITPSLIVDGFFSGLRVVGASVETNEAPETGLKMDDNGLTNYGMSSVVFGEDTRQFKVRAVIDNRVNQWGDSSEEVLPGFWLESEPSDGTGTPPLFAAGLTITETDAKAARIRSAMETPESSYGEIVAHPGGATMTSYGELPFGSNHRLKTSTISIFEDTFTIGTAGEGYAYGAQVSHLGDRILRLFGEQGVMINGTPYGASQTRVKAPLQAGWTHWANASWNGLWIEQMGKLTIISGAVGRSSWSEGATIAVVPAQFRPSAKLGGTNCEIQPNGNLNVGPAGTAATVVSITYFAA